MEKAAFTLKNYVFSKVEIDYGKKQNANDKEINIDLDPSGILYEDDSIYLLTFLFKASTSANEPFVEIKCEANFTFNKKVTKNTIPDFFYKNSIAILFPYIRAFVSTVTLQTNADPIVLPTMNLSSLEHPLKENTKVAG